MIYFITSLLSLLTIILCERLWREPLFNLSVDWMKSQPADSQLTGWTVYSEFGGGTIDAAILAMMFPWVGIRSSTVYFAIAVSCKVFVFSVGKMLYMEPRPFWTDLNIPVHELKCS